ncbi:MAG: hypothetical protein H6839_05745 [Planctomycetes bacterium]|nr:hypothetical protein [Planctomycetota bacterium]
MSDFDDHLLDRELTEALGNDGPAPELKGRILNAVNARPPARTRRPSGRVMPLPVKRTPWGAYVAAAAALALAVAAFGWALSRPDTKKEDKQPVSEGKPVTLPANTPVIPDENYPAPEPQPEPDQPEDKPAPQPDLPEPKSEPKPEPHPEPKPEPAPEKPDDVVEKPEPKPQPEPDKPDTEAKPEKRAVVATVSADAKLRFRELESADWRTLEGGEIREGWQLKAEVATDLALAGGVRLRLDGEVSISTERITLLGRHTQLYVDALGTTEPLLLARDDMRIELTGSEALFDADTSAIEIYCYVGSVSAGEAIAGGRRAKLSPRGLSGLRDLKDSEHSPRLLKDMPPRSLVRCDFDSAEGVTADSVKDGIAIVKGDNAQLSLKLPRELTTLPGTELRLRFRAAKAGALYVQLQKDAGQMQWGKWTKLAKLGEWLEWSIPIGELQRDDGRSEAAMQAGDAFININLFIQDGTEAELELDWLEIVRVR